MKALVYGGPGKKALEDRPHPRLQHATDAVDAYDTFARAAATRALKVLIEFS